MRCNRCHRTLFGCECEEGPDNELLEDEPAVKHNKEPWVMTCSGGVESPLDRRHICDSSRGGNDDAFVAEGRANMARIVDCVNFCEGIEFNEDGQAPILVEVASVLQLLNGLAEQWGDEAVFRRCRDRLRALLPKSPASE